MNVLLGEPEPIKLKEDKKPYVAIFIGPTGVGKTTTLAKIAADFTLNRQKKVALITADTYRIAAVEQLRTYAEILNLPVTVVYSPSEIKDAIERLSDNDIILIDTAGRSHKNKTHFDELKALVSAANADETFLVMSCNTSRIAIREIIEYYAFIRNYKLLFTKLDESSVPGVILNARYMTGKPLSYTTAGQSVPDDLDIADAKQLVSSILGKGGI
jgi:flagellar biosynthesis protein FlhF